MRTLAYIGVMAMAVGAANCGIREAVMLEAQDAAGPAPGADASVDGGTVAGDVRVSTDVVDFGLVVMTSTATALVSFEAPNRMAVIEWRDVRNFAHNTLNHRRFTFQLALEEGSNLIHFLYGNTETSGAAPTVSVASVGIENEAGALGLDPLGCTPNCDGRPRPPRADGFPQQSGVTFTP